MLEYLYRASQKEWALKNTDKYGAILKSVLHKVSPFRYLIATLFTY